MDRHGSGEIPLILRETLSLVLRLGVKVIEMNKHIAES